MSSPTAGVLPAGTKVKLTVIRGNRAGKTYGVKEGLTYIGRKGPQPVDIDLDQHEQKGKVFAINRHACIVYEKGLLQIVEAGTQNGTLLNRVKLPPRKRCPLKAEDVIQVGNVVLQVKVQAKRKTAAQK